MLSNNNISGSIPSVLSSATKLLQLQLETNQISGLIPTELGMLTELTVLFRLAEQTWKVAIPSELAGCKSLQAIDLSHNALTGSLPPGLFQLQNLTKLLLISNEISGSIPAVIGNLPDEIGKCSALQLLNLSNNSLGGSSSARTHSRDQYPLRLVACSSLQLLDLSSNELTGTIPEDLFEIEALDIALNLSFNALSGIIPPQVSALNKLSILDLSHNKLEGDLLALSGLENLVSLNISYNNFTGYLPDEKLFRQLSATDLAGNEGLCSRGHDFCFLSNVYRTRKMMGEDNDSEMGGDSWPWQFTPFRRFGINAEVRDSFSAEVKTLGSIRHKNIVRFLGCCWNRNTRLLMYEYMPNGSLGGLLHERSGTSRPTTSSLVQTLTPALLISGLPSLSMKETSLDSSNTVAGSYGYIAPEYGYMMKITEKSDVYSYGVVVLEVLTGKQPIDPTIPDGLHIVDWARKYQLQCRNLISHGGATFFLPSKSQHKLLCILIDIHFSP
ncbi:hypothetical protein L3X38_044765 [Prunus dulcis]|uniref:Serine-threonine/tyrosine-protein kinase catalytic domain-containing protein n=1 Tax=Prunus dulcis TaxID=3755 RepID=A0AAD4V0L1_PRUDU|nr:hypothetical protein L3X38_044765 [Prunus dulcis]